MIELKLQDVTVGYHHPVPAIKEISMRLREGEIVAMIGPNGAGKTTTLTTISGLLRPWKGSITLDGHQIGGRSPRSIVKQGIAHVPEGRRVLPGLTVAENLAMGGYTLRSRQRLKQALDNVLTLFPALSSRLRQAGGTLSGGEQQMLAIARALMSEPKFLLLDEPSMGLAPVIVDRIIDHVLLLRARGLGILLVEQNASIALEISDHAYVLEQGSVALSGASTAIRVDPKVRESYLAVRTGH